MIGEHRVVAFKQEYQLLDQPDGSFVLRSPYATVPMRMPSPAYRALMRRLANEGIATREISELAISSGTIADIPAMHALVQRFETRGMLCEHITANGVLHAVVVADRQGDAQHLALRPDTRYRLSRFAFLRPVDGRMRMETPHSAATVELYTPEIQQYLGALAGGRTIGELGTHAPLPALTLHTFLELLLQGRFIESDMTGGAGSESVAQAHWEFHDLLFHSRSRLGRHSNGYGGSYPHKDRFAPPPAARPTDGAVVIPLPRPDLHEVAQHDLTLGAALEQRQSVRDHSGPPPTLGELGELLYRAARVRQTMTASDGMTLTRRPYPAGGSIYELDIYPVVNQCTGLDAGMYRYDPFQHALVVVAGLETGGAQLLADAQRTAMMDHPPHVLLNITARFQRVQWKYQSVAYALVLKHVGALYQTLYLVATAMGLAPCALGGGNADQFATAASLDYYEETSVGEFLLGRSQTV